MRQSRLVLSRETPRGMFFYAATFSVYHSTDLAPSESESRLAGDTSHSASCAFADRQVQTSAAIRTRDRVTSKLVDIRCGLFLTCRYLTTNR